MKKIKILLPLLTITTPLISMVSCKGNIDESIKLDITCQDEHIKVKSQPDETKINKTIVIEYSVDDTYIEDIIIRRGKDTITYDCHIDKVNKIITIPAKEVTADLVVLLNANPTYKWVLDDDAHTATLKKYYGTETEITIPQSITIESKSYTVTTIGEGAFGSTSPVTKIVLPITVKTIEQFAFNGAKNLAQINCDNIEKIGANAFQGTHIQQTILGSVTEIKSGAFCECKQLASASISSDIVDLPYSLFSGCSKLALITLPSSIQNLSLGLFSNCTSLSIIYCQGLTKTQWMELQRPDYGSWRTGVPSTCQVYLQDGNYPIDEVE